MKTLILKWFNFIYKKSLGRTYSHNKMSGKLNNDKITEQIEIIKKHAVKLKKYPVSPYFTQKVMNMAKVQPKEDVWINLQFFPVPVVKFTLFTLLVIIIFLLIPFNYDNNVQETTSPDSITILYQVDSIDYEITSDEQALQFALLN